VGITQDLLLALHALGEINQEQQVLVQIVMCGASNKQQQEMENLQLQYTEQIPSAPKFHFKNT
jgi:hypothetical protein